jgi:L-lactate utilization protein LutC
MDYSKFADNQSVAKTKKSLEDKGYKVFLVRKSSEALTILKKMIPSGVSVMNGTSMTLEKMGYIELLKSGNHKWKNVHESIVAEKDPIKQAKLRKEATSSDFYLGSVHAVTETGDFLIGSNTGSQLPNVVFNSPNLIFVVSTKKIVADLEQGMKRLNDYVVPLENKRAMAQYNAGTALNKIVIFKGENAMMRRKVTFILVEEDLGF